MILQLEVRWLTGSAVLGDMARRDRAEWPPHPDRLFLALVAAWGERGSAEDEAAALGWLEGLGAPLIDHPAAAVRSMVDVYVPPNDASPPAPTKKGKKKDGDKDKKQDKMPKGLYVLPQLRMNRQPRQFPTLAPEAPVRFAWTVEPDAAAAHLPALARLAAEVTCLGHSSSLIQLVVATPPALEEPAPGVTRLVPATAGQASAQVLRVPFSGRLAQVAEGWRLARKTELDAGETEQTRPVWRPPAAPGRGYRSQRAAVERPPARFDRDWIVLRTSEDAEPPSQMHAHPPDFVAFAFAARLLRQSLMSLADQPVPPLISGHGEDRGPLTGDHMAIVPIADIDHPHASGRLLGLGILVPRAAPEDQVRALRRALARFLGKVLPAETDDEEDRWYGTLDFRHERFVWPLELALGDQRRAFSTGRYTRPARRWATVTPMVLGKHPKDRPGHRVEDVIRESCRHAGLPEPETVTSYKHGAFAGTPPAAPPSGAPPHTAMLVPQDSGLGTRPRHHVVLTFAEEVEGPVLLGAGRFTGLGFCRPLAEGAS